MCLLFGGGQCFFFFNDTATPEIYTLSLHDALPISQTMAAQRGRAQAAGERRLRDAHRNGSDAGQAAADGCGVGQIQGPRRAVADLGLHAGSLGELFPIGEFGGLG